MGKIIISVRPDAISGWRLQYIIIIFLGQNQGRLELLQSEILSLGVKDFAVPAALYCPGLRITRKYFLNPRVLANVFLDIYGFNHLNNLGLKQQAPINLLKQTGKIKSISLIKKNIEKKHNLRLT